MSLSVHMRRDDAHVSIASLLKSISKSLPAGTSLQQRVALTSTLDSFYTTRALVDGLIDAQRISQVFNPPLCYFHSHPYYNAFLSP